MKRIPQGVYKRGLVPFIRRTLTLPSNVPVRKIGEGLNFSVYCVGKGNNRYAVKVPRPALFGDRKVSSNYLRGKMFYLSALHDVPAHAIMRVEVGNERRHITIPIIVEEHAGGALNFPRQWPPSKRFILDNLEDYLFEAITTKGRVISDHLRYNKKGRRLLVDTFFELRNHRYDLADAIAGNIAIAYRRSDRLGNQAERRAQEFLLNFRKERLWRSVKKKLGQKMTTAPARAGA